MAEKVEIVYVSRNQEALAQMKNMNAQLLLINTNLNKMNATNTRATAQTRLFSSSVNKLGLRFIGFNFILNQVAGGVQKLVQFVGESIEAYREFGLRTAEVNTILGKEGNEVIGRLASSVEHLSVTYGKSTSDLTKGLYDILSAAFSAKDAINLLNTATRAAIAGLSEVRTSVDIFTTVLNSYGMAVEQAAHVSDTLFQSVIRGKFQFEELESALGYVVPIAAQAGIAFDELMAALSTATRHGLHLDMAARGLAMNIQNIIDPSEQAAKAAEKYGVEMNGLAMRAMGLKNWFEEVYQKTQEFGKHILVELIPNIRSLRVAMVLAGEEGLAGFSEDLAEVTAAAGKTEAALQKIQNTSQFVANQLTQEMENLKRDIGDSFDELALGVKGVAVDIGTAISQGLRIFTVDIRDLGKLASEWQQIARNKIFLEGLTPGDDDLENAKQYLRFMQAANDLSKQLAGLREMGKTGTSEYNVIKSSLETMNAAAAEYEGSWNAIVGEIYDAQQALSDNQLTIQEINYDIESLLEKLEKPIQVGWGTYKKEFKGTLDYELEALKAEQNRVDNQHDIKMGLIDENYQYKVLNEEMQEAVRITREWQNAQEAHRKEVEKTSIAMRLLQLETMKIQLAGMMRRRGLTRGEEKRLKQIQIEQMKLRITEMESQKDVTKEVVNNYNEKQDMIDKFLARLSEEEYQLKYTYDQEIMDLESHIASEKAKLEKRYEWWDSTNSQIFASSADLITNLKELLQDEELTTLMEDWGLDLAGILQNIQSIQTTATTSKAPGKTTATSAILSTPGATETLTKMSMALSRTPEVMRAQILSTMPSSVRSLLGYRRGIEYLPRTEPILGHAGEMIVPSGRDIGPGNVTVNVKVTGNTIASPADEDVLASKVASAVEQNFIDARTGKSRFKLR